MPAWELAEELHAAGQAGPQQTMAEQQSRLELYQAWRVAEEIQERERALRNFQRVTRWYGHQLAVERMVDRREEERRWQQQQEQEVQHQPPAPQDEMELVLNGVWETDVFYRPRSSLAVLENWEAAIAGYDV